MWHLLNEKEVKHGFAWCGLHTEAANHDHVTSRRVLNRDDWRPADLFCPTCVAKERQYILETTPKGRKKFLDDSED